MFDILSSYLEEKEVKLCFDGKKITLALDSTYVTLICDGTNPHQYFQREKKNMNAA